MEHHQPLVAMDPGTIQKTESANKQVLTIRKKISEAPE